MCLRRRDGSLLDGLWRLGYGLGRKLDDGGAREAGCWWRRRRGGGFRGQLVLWILKSPKERQNEGEAGDLRRKLVVMELGFPVMASVGGPQYGGNTHAGEIRQARRPRQ